MRAAKILGIALASYVLVVVLFEIFVVTVQPDMSVGIVLTTTGADGKASDRKLAGVRMDDRLYVSANHWPRPWYHRALANPAVEVTEKGERRPYTAVPVTGDELVRIKDRYRFPLLFKFLTGFAPRKFLRLDPR
jgi:hypothetical protein